MAYESNTYEISKNVLSGNTLTLKNVDNTYEIFKAIHDTEKDALRANILNLPSGVIPGGNDTEIQFNDGGVFAGDINFTWDKKNDAITIGSRTGVTGVGSFVSGNGCVASGLYSHAEGRDTVASSNSSHAEGYFTTASGHYSHAEGQFSEASGNWSHTEGEGTVASGNWSHAEGGSTVASDLYSHAEGHYTVASGTASHAEGHYTVANGDNSHAGGNGNFTFPVIALGSSTFNHSHRENHTPSVVGATGDYSAILGGKDHSTISINSYIIGGDTNKSESDNSGIIGGVMNSIKSNTYSTVILGGDMNLINSNSHYSAILGGENNIIGDGITHSAIIAGDNQTLNTSSTIMMPRIELSLYGEGIIMKSPNGTAYKLTVDDSGNLISTAI